ncbi:hypothetical protein [Gottfriedia acidiceleris]|uniref:hypothetical protein n=1 Tax=Gottfriedia acidiceleris TaxID=371036 RepID=UPI00300066EB
MKLLLAELFAPKLLTLALLSVALLIFELTFVVISVELVLFVLTSLLVSFELLLLLVAL